MALDDKLQNAAQNLTGKAKEHVGKQTGDENLQADGRADQTESKVKKLGEDVKDIFR